MSTIVKNSNEHIENFIYEAVNRAVKEKIEKLYEKKKNDLIKEITEMIDREKAETVAGVLVDMTKMVDMQIYQDRIIFTIKTNNK